MTATVVVGLGNPILGDDAVGLHVARAVARELGRSGGVDIKELHAGGIRVMDAVAGYERAIIVDAMCTGAHPAGCVRRLAIEELGAARTLASTHDTNLPTALALGRMLGMQMPEKLTIVGIEAVVTGSFAEELSEAVERSVHEAVRLIVGEVRS